MRGVERNSYFTRQFLKNLFVCALVIVIIMPLCISFYAAFDEHQQENYRNTLQSMLNDINSNLNVMRNLTRNTEINESLQRVNDIRGKALARDTIALFKAREYISILAQSNPYIAECMVVFSRNDIILTKRSVYYTRKEFSNFYQFSGMELDEWIEKVKSYQAKTRCLSVNSYTYKVMNNTISDVGETQKLAFCYGVPFAASRASGEFFLFISEDALIEKLPENFRALSELTIQDESGETIYRYRGEKYTENARSVEVALGGYGDIVRMTARLNTAAIFDVLSSTLVLLICYLIGALLAVVGLAAFFTMHQFKPMKSVLEQLRDFGYTLPRNKEQFSFVVQSIENMQRKHRDVTQTLAHYRDQLRNTQIERLLNNPYVPGMQMPDGLPAQYRIGYAYVLADEEQTDSTLLGTLVVRQMRHCAPKNVWVHQIENDVFALIIPAEVSTDELRDMLARINADLPQTVCLAMSAQAQGPEEMHAAFENARMNAMGQSAADVLRMPQVKEIHHGMSVQSGMRLYQEIISGNTQRACECVGEMMRKSALPFANVAECYEYIRLNICFAIQDAHLPEEFAPPTSPGAVPPEKLLQMLLQSVEQLCQTERVRTMHQRTHLETEVFAWVEENLSDGTLNAETVAHRFAISERKVQSIARQTGEASFSGYLQRQRMRLVAKLLEETDLPVSDIGIRAGYNTPSTFFKAFKRMYGISPGEYRTLYSK